MKVILLEDIKGTGKKGDMVEVSDGHGRNFLIPKGLAKKATEGNVKEMKAHKKSMKKRKEEELDDAKALKEKIEKLEVTIKAKAGDGGRLFGSVTNNDIAKAMASQHKIKIDKKKIDMEGPIRQLGYSQVPCKLHQEVTATIKVHVIEE